MTDLELKQTAAEIRKGIVTAVHAAKSGHPGGSLSAADGINAKVINIHTIKPLDKELVVQSAKETKKLSRWKSIPLSEGLEAQWRRRLQKRRRRYYCGLASVTRSGNRVLRQNFWKSTDWTVQGFINR